LTPPPLKKSGTHGGDHSPSAVYKQTNYVFLLFFRKKRANLIDHISFPYAFT
jgi:hypothetical protein